MITSQDIREKTFEKAVFGGYDMESVDKFLEELANDLAAMQKENQMLKGKMKVLVNKVEEYRGNEDALRMAVLSAQKLGNMIEKEAREKADAMVNEAMTTAADITRQAKAEVDAEQARLAKCKSESAEFIDNMNLLCRRQLSFLEKVGEMDFVHEMHEAKTAELEATVAAALTKEPAEIHETVKSIEETMAKVMDEPVLNVSPEMMSAKHEDEMPTRAFNVVSDPGDNVEKTTQFSFEGFDK